MGAKTAIAWTDATVNFWWGCTKVGPGCDHCYAEQWAKRTGHDVWGVGVPRRKIGSAERLIGRLNDRQPGNRVFVQSMSDIFDLEVPIEWFDHAWNCVHAAERLRIQVVTKRVTAIEKRLAATGTTWPRHAGLIITVVNQEEADRDVPRALALKAKLGIPWLGLSIEPQLGPINLAKVDVRGAPNEPPIYRVDALNGIQENFCTGQQRDVAKVDWVISGGESKQGKDHQPRAYDLAWPRSLRDQCATAGVAFFEKQLGSRPLTNICLDVRPLSMPIDAPVPDRMPRWLMSLKDRAGADPSEWPEDLRVMQFPEALR